MTISEIIMQFTGYLVQTVPTMLLFFAGVPREYFKRSPGLCIWRFLWLLPVLAVGFTLVANTNYISRSENFQLYADIYMTLTVAIYVWQVFRMVDMNWKKKVICLLLVIQFQAVIVNCNGILINTQIPGNPQQYRPYYPENLLMLFLMTAVLGGPAYLLMTRIVRRNLSHIEGKVLERGCLYVMAAVGIYLLLATVRIGEIEDRIWIQMGVLACTVLIYIIYFTEISLVKRQVQIEEQMHNVGIRYQLVQENIERTRRTRHDMRHQLHAVRALYEAGNWEELGTFLKSNESRLEELEVQGENSRCPILDSLLEYYLQYARNYGIAVTSQVDVVKEPPFEMVDMTNLIGNAMENAIEACSQLPGERRCLELEVQEKENTLLIQIRNSCRDTGSLAGKAQTFSSTKVQPGHGIGLKSMEQIVEKYQGMLVLRREGGVFITKIILKIRGGG